MSTKDKGQDVAGRPVIVNPERSAYIKPYGIRVTQIVRNAAPAVLYEEARRQDLSLTQDSFKTHDKPAKDNELMNHSPLLILGATGKTGRRIVQRLSEKGHAVL